VEGERFNDVKYSARSRIEVHGSEGGHRSHGY
jgi:hypothetical protein